jgi:hypothetical protein
MHVRHRVYLADLARWTRRDPAGYVDGMNVYAYVGAMPVGMVDPMGLISCGGGHTPSQGDDVDCRPLDPPGSIFVDFLGDVIAELWNLFTGGGTDTGTVKPGGNGDDDGGDDDDGGCSDDAKVPELVSHPSPHSRSGFGVNASTSGVLLTGEVWTGSVGLNFIATDTKIDFRVNFDETRYEINRPLGTDQSTPQPTVTKSGSGIEISCVSGEPRIGMDPGGQPDIAKKFADFSGAFGWRHEFVGHEDLPGPPKIEGVGVWTWDGRAAADSLELDLFSSAAISRSDSGVPASVGVGAGPLSISYSFAGVIMMERSCRNEIQSMSQH